MRVLKFLWNFVVWCILAIGVFAVLLWFAGGTIVFADEIEIKTTEQLIKTLEAAVEEFNKVPPLNYNRQFELIYNIGVIEGKIRRDRELEADSDTERLP